MPFFDTNVLVYSVDPADPVKQAIARQALRSASAQGNLVLSTQVMQEFYRVALRKQLLDGPAATGMLAFWARERVLGATAQAVLHATELQQQLRVSIWDALIICAALDAGCTQLLSEDLQHGTRVGELEIVNPFILPPAVHEPAATYAVKRASRARKVR